MSVEALAARKQRTGKILRTLHKTFPDARCQLTHENPMQLLVAVILSAQCTDAQVNKVTPALFDKYATPADFAKIPPATLEKNIYSTGFYRNKTKNILAAAKMIIEQFDGQVPTTMDQLLTLPGVARKTANVILSTAFGRDEGIVVDTHVIRLAQRLGLSTQKNPVKIEQDLMPLMPSSEWDHFGHLIQSHGRKYCTARNPNCPDCPIASLCPWEEKRV